MENKTGKYFKYAIGEIILVVIGILIALSINNWNEENKEKKELTIIYNSIITQLQSDIVTADRILPIFEMKKVNMERIINDEVTKEEWLRSDSIASAFFSFPDFEINKERYELLKQKNSVDEDSRILNNKITEFYNQFTIDINVRNKEVDESFYNNLGYWRENTSWYSELLYERDRKELYEYTKDNPQFRNRIVHHRIMISRLQYMIQKYRDESDKIKNDIIKYIEK